MGHRFGILGPLEAPVAVPRGRVRELVALLLVHRGGVLPPGRIAEELWDGDGPRHPRNAVQVVVSRARAALGEAVVRSAGGGYALPLSPGALDADRFTALATEGRRLLAAASPQDAGTVLREALGLWRGPALGDVGDRPFAWAEAARLERLRLSCTADRLDADLACDRHAEAAAELEALVATHPFDERLRAQLMVALYRCGRPADALASYRDACRALHDGLGLAPSPRLRALEGAILTHAVPAAA